MSALAGITQLNPEQITALLGKSRSRGEYTTQLRNFIESGMQGAQVSLENGPFAGKKVASVKSGFENAKSNTKNPVEGSEHIAVVVDGDNVFLINKALAQATAPTAAPEEVAA